MTPILSRTPIFYGVNGHFDYTQPPAIIVANLKTLGMKVYRATWEGSDASTVVLVALAAAFQADGTGLKLYVCLDVDMTYDGANMWQSEFVAMAYARAAAKHVAAMLLPYADSVLAFECGNELTRKQGITDPFPAVQGTQAADYSNTKWPILRGVSHGAFDGVKEIMPWMPCATNPWVFSESAALRMYMTGTNPDGTVGHGIRHYDIIAAHFYNSWGNPANEPYDGDGTGPRFCWLEDLSSYGKPVFCSEGNGDAGAQTQADQIAYVSLLYYTLYANRARYNIAGFTFYALYSDPWNLLNDADGTPNAVGTVVKNFIAANPDV